jgi:inhibitor of cysteine peptidase
MDTPAPHPTDDRPYASGISRSMRNPTVSGTDVIVLHRRRIRMQKGHETPGSNRRKIQSMKAKAAVIWLMATLLLVVAGCTPEMGASPAQEANVEVSINEFTDSDDIAKEVQIAEGGALTVSLGSNPSTGFTWTEMALIADATVLRQTGGGGFMEAEGTQVVGAAGTQTWTFEALKKGTTTISMEYGRPWEGGEKGAWTFELTVIVK